MNIARKFLKTAKNQSNNNLMRVLPDTEKLDFVSKSVSWIQGKDITDSCFILNYGYEAPLPWPQVLSNYISRIPTARPPHHPSIWL